MNATNRLAQPNGFWGNPQVRIPLPGVLGQTQRTLSRMRMSGPLDQLQENLNHAAESVMPQAASLFTNAVRTITIARVDRPVYFEGRLVPQGVNVKVERKLGQ